MISLRNVINKKKVTQNENPDKIINIVERILDFNKRQRGKGLKISTPKQMLQKLPVALAQVKTDNISEKL